MTDADRIARLRERAEKAEDLAGRQERMIAWLCSTLARTQGKAVRDDGELVCCDLPSELCDKLCPRGAEGCAECWAIAAEVAVTPIEHYLKPEYQGRVLIDESAEDFMERKRREARPAGRARVLDFSTGRLKGGAE